MRRHVGRAIPSTSHVQFELGPPLLELEETNEDGHDGWTSIRPRSRHASRQEHQLAPEDRVDDIDLAA